MTTPRMEVALKQALEILSSYDHEQQTTFNHALSTYDEGEDLTDGDRILWMVLDYGQRDEAKVPS